MNVVISLLRLWGQDWHEVSQRSKAKVVAERVADMVIMEVAECSRNIASSKNITKFPEPACTE